MKNRIQFTKGCPNNCEYCHEPRQMEYLFPTKLFSLRDQEVQILDMNFLANPYAVDHIKELGLLRCTTELVCGIDYRLLTQEIAYLLKDNHFIKIRWARGYYCGSAGHVSQEQVKRYIQEQMGKDVFEYDIYGCPTHLKGQLKIGDFS